LILLTLTKHKKVLFKHKKYSFEYARKRVTLAQVLFKPLKSRKDLKRVEKLVAAKSMKT
jgi:hypothetical protein